MTKDSSNITQVNNVALLTLNNPPVNALDIDFSMRLQTMLDNLGANKEVSALVITGTSQTFCAGLNLKKVPFYGPDEQKNMILSLSKLLYGIYSLPLPTIAAINGHAIAGGLVLALACDYRIGVSSPCQIGLTEARVGVPFPVCALELVKAETNKSICRKMMLTGENMDQNQALKEGILDELIESDKLIDRALLKAQDLATMPNQSYAQIKLGLRQRALAAMKAVIDTESDPIFSSWLNHDTKEAATSVL